MNEIQLNPLRPLRTERLVLRQILASDAQEILFLRSDERVMEFICRERAQTINDAIAFITRINDSLQSDAGITWGISLKDEDTLIGTIGFYRLVKEHFRAEVGYLLHPDHWGKGIMTEALETVVHYGFHTLNFHTIEADLDPNNTGSKRILEKAGFIQEGHFKENYYYKGVFLDTLVYSKIKPKD
jgi:[ribosomal protein S5]-alanine N-acetyltransferase